MASSSGGNSCFKYLCNPQPFGENLPWHDVNARMTMTLKNLIGFGISVRNILNSGSLKFVL